MVYRQPLSSFGNFGFLENLTLQATANWSLERGGFRSLTLFDAAELDRVSRVNASIGVETEKWSLIARGENITDAELPLSTATLYRRVDPDTFELEFTWRLR